MTEENEVTFEENTAYILFNYSVKREDLKELADSIIDNSTLSEQTILYELQILKIISTGVSINYLIKTPEAKNKISEYYWKYILDFSASVTEATKEYSNVELNYFDVIKEKLDFYLKELNQNKSAAEPASVIGPSFAHQCGDDSDTFAVMAGAKLFKSVIGGLSKFFEKEGLV